MEKEAEEVAKAKQRNKNKWRSVLIPLRLRRQVLGPD